MWHGSITPSSATRRRPRAQAVLGDEKAAAGTRAALRSAAPHLRRELGRQIRLKVTPELRFEQDEISASADRIDVLLEQVQADGDHD